MLFKNLEAWQAAQAAIREIEPHPNQPPPPAQPPVPAKLDERSEEPSGGGSGQIGARGEDGGVGMESLREQIDRVEASNKPLPLPEGQGMVEGNAVEGRGKDQSDDDPLGPL